VPQKNEPIIFRFAFRSTADILSNMNDTLFDKAFVKVKLLSTIFRTNENRYLSAAYQEAEVRKDFIDKFFASLGWDVNHDEQIDPYAQEVKVERGVETRTVDYAFFLKPNYRDANFLVEAKKPSRNIENPDFYFQTIRYGYNANCPVCVLTDFEQFHVIDCRHKPDIDSALSRSIEKFTYSDYADRDKFARIYWLFSREAVTGGSLTKFAESLPKPRGKARQRGLLPSGYKPVDESLLEELDEFRVALAKTFKAGNPKLDSETLTELAQRVLDRLVFMRFLEDKLIEPQQIIDKFGKNGDVWHDFNSACRRLDGIYNGIVFKRHNLLDAPNFRVDKDDFSKIVKEISRANSPYDFNSIPIHILGSIYERFLGKVIVATDKRVHIEDKPEVRKAGGVYYTPEYIVRYIVENTVGKLITGKTPEQIAKMRFADIACGSGSFLLGVYDLLLQYHGNYFNANPKKAKKGDCIERDGKLYLSLGKKRDILLNNIYGVDIDAQAVEVCQLSLYLKLLAEETTASAHQYLLDFERQALLPTLTNNIVCGNSLIGTDILEGKLFAGDEEKKLNPMNFEDAYPEIMKGGGFDAIVGNPPYGMVTDLIQKSYFEQHFTAMEGRFDTFQLFIERATKLSGDRGLVGYIVPSPLLSNLYARSLRRYILNNCSMEEITNFGFDVFDAPTIHTCIIILSRERKLDATVKVRKQVISQDALHQAYDYEIQQNKLGANTNFVFDIFFDPQASGLLSKLSSNGQPIGEIYFIRQCIKTGNDDKYVQNSKHSPGQNWKPSLRGKSIERYFTKEKDIFIRYGAWLARNWANKSFYETPKIAIRETGNRITATIDLENRYFLSSLYAIYPKSPTEILSLHYLLAMLNSSIATYFVKKVALELTKGAFTKLRTNQLARLPIRRINFSDPADKQKHDEIVVKVEAMLEAKKELASAKTDKDKNYYEAKCTGLDRQIDRLVYDLYGLTADEIHLVEESASW